MLSLLKALLPSFQLFDTHVQLQVPGVPVFQRVAVTSTPVRASNPPVLDWVNAT